MLKVGDVISLLEEKGFRLTKLRMGLFTKEGVLEFYGDGFEKGPLFQ